MAQDKKQKWISNKIATLRREGYGADQAAAIAYSMYEDRKKQNGGYGPRSLQDLQNLPGPLQYPNPPQSSSNSYPQTRGFYTLSNNFGQSLPQAPQIATIENPDSELEIQQRQAVTSVFDPQYVEEIQDNVSNNLIQTPTAEEQLQQTAQNTLDSGQLEGYQQKKENNIYRVPQPPNYQTFNPYGGVDIPTAAAYLGTSIESGNTLGTVGSSLKLATGIARNAFGAAGRQRRNEEMQDEYQQQLRDYYAQTNNATYMQDGGAASIPEPPKLTPYQNGREKIDQSKLMTGEFLTGVSNNNTAVEPNSEVEDDEYILTPEGDSMKVVGKTHEQGGEEVQLQEGDMVISDHLKLKGQNAKKLRQEFDINVKAKNTYAEAVDKIYNKIGLSKIIQKEEDVLKRIKKEEEETNDETTKNLNLQFLYNERDKILKEKQEVEPKRLKALKSVFIMQEQSKPEGEGTDFGLGMYQDGGQKLSPYAYIMFEGTPEQQSFVQADMSRYFDPNGELYEANNRQESAEEHLERMRPIYEKMRESDTLNEYVEKNASFLNKDYNINEQVINDLAKQHGISSVRARELFTEFKKGGKFKKYQDGDQKEEDLFYISTASGEVFPQRKVDNFYGNLTEEDVEELKRRNPWYNWEGFNLQTEKDVLDFQKAFNERVDMGNRLLEDNKLGAQTASAGMFSVKEAFDDLNYLQAMGEIPTSSVDAKTTTEEEKDEPNKESVVETSNRQETSLGLPMLPNMSILPPGGVSSQLMTNRRYDRLTPYEVSPEQIIQENQRQAQAAMQSVQGLPDAQRAAAVAQINSNTQEANANAIYQTEVQNAQIANQTAAQNAQIQMREEDMAASDALSYEQRQQTAQAITEEQIQQYYDFLRRSNVSKFNDIRRMNTINQIMPNYNIDSQGNITVTGTGATQAGLSSQARALLAGQAPLQDPTKS